MGNEIIILLGGQFVIASVTSWITIAKLSTTLKHHRELIQVNKERIDKLSQNQLRVIQ